MGRDVERRLRERLARVEALHAGATPASAPAEGGIPDEVAAPEDLGEAPVAAEEGEQTPVPMDWR